MPKRTGVLLAYLLFLALSAIIYAQSLDAPFVFDDGMFIVDNPLVTREGYLLEPSRVLETSAMDSVKASRITRYLGYASFRLNYLAIGLNTRGYHMVNIALHAASGLMVYLLCLGLLEALRAQGRNQWPALFGALLFLLHPIQSEAVSYITQRFALMAALFYIGSLALYLWWRLGQGRLYLALSLAMGVLAMFTKENAFTLPVAIAFLEFGFFEASLTERAKRFWPFALLMAIVPLCVVLGATGEEATRLNPEVTRLGYLATQLRAMATYMRLLALPINQTLDYDYPLMSLASAGPLFGLALMLVASYLGYKGWRKGGLMRMAGLGVALYFLSHSVESSIVVLVNLFFEHRLYLPMAGVSVISAALIAHFEQKGPTLQIRGLGLAVLVLLLLLSYSRAGVWSSGLALWGDAASKAPLKPRPHMNAAKGLEDKGLLEEAEAEYARALNLPQRHHVDIRFTAHYNLAGLYKRTGRAELARQHYKAALGLTPMDYKGFRAMVLYNLGNLSRDTGRIDLAIAYWTEAVAMDRGHSKAWNQIGNYRVMAGDRAGALEAYTASIAADPDNAEAYYNLGMAYEGIGDMAQAKAAYRKFILKDRDQHRELAKGLSDRLGSLE